LTQLSLTDPVNGTTADASVIATNNANIRAVINGGIDNGNINASAGIAASKLAGYPNTAGVFLNGQGNWVAPTSGVSYRKTTTKAVNTTTSATDLLNGEITIGANVLGTSNLAFISAWGDWKQNSGGTAGPPQMQLLLGASTLIDTNSIGLTVPNAATREPWFVDALIMNSGATNTQIVKFNLRVYSSANPGNNLVAAFTTGTGVYMGDNTTSLIEAAGVTTGAVDTTSGQALKLNVINASASANYETKLFGCLVVIL
jgi:hypothetical protein